MNEQEVTDITSSPEVLALAKLVDQSLSGAVPSLHFSGDRSKSIDKIWAALRREVYDLLCTDSAKYASERAAVSATLKPGIAALAAFLTRDYGLPVATASGLASLFLILPLRMAKGAWCSVAVSGEPVQIERTALAQLVTARPAQN